MIQVKVENETGILGTRRDQSPPARAAFEQDVPDQLMTYLRRKHDSLAPEMRSILEKNGFETTDKWYEVFGESADEVFMAWNMAHYTGRVAAAGKKEYPLPMYENCSGLHMTPLNIR